MTKKTMALHCPTCRSTMVTLYAGGQLGKYLCQHCGYVGNLVLDYEEKQGTKKAGKNYKARGRKAAGGITL